MRTLEPKRDETRTKNHVNRIAKAASCGRILGVNDAYVAERSYVCDQTQLCGPCHYRRSNDRVKAAAQGDFFLSRRKAFHFVLTTPCSYSHEDELSGFYLMKKAWKPILKAINSQTKSLGIERSFTKGIHSKSLKGTKFHSAHMHLVVVTGPTVHGPSLRHAVRETWWSLSEAILGQRAVVKEAIKGRSVTAAKKPRKNCMSRQRLDNLCAYVIRPLERDDTPYDIVHRESLFGEAGICRASSTSRSKSKRQKLPTKPNFDPIRLGKKSILVYRWKEKHPVLLPTEDYDHEYLRLTQEIDAYLNKMLKRHWRTVNAS